MIGLEAVDHTACLEAISDELVRLVTPFAPMFMSHGVAPEFTIEPTIPTERNRFCSTAVCSHGVTWWVQPTGRFLAWMESVADTGHAPDCDGNCG